MVEIVAGNGLSLTGNSFTDDSDTSKLEKNGVINYLGEKLWQQMDFRINDTPSILPTVSIRVKVTWKLFFFTWKQKLKLYLVECNFFEKDSGNITASYPTTSSKNSGLVNHSAQFEVGKKVMIYTCPRANICHQDLYLLNGCKLDIKLHPNPNQFEQRCG